MQSHLRRLMSWLPVSLQRAVRRAYVRRSLRRGRFVSREYEFQILHELVKPRDWVLDIGANFGVYTAKLSDLVGPQGRVIAMEPVQQTFDILNAVVQELPLRNVTMLNVASFDRPCVMPLRIPTEESGMENLYESALDPDASGPMALCLSIDALALPERIAVAKIDTEGAELSVLRGMSATLERDHPILIVEWIPGMDEIIEFLTPFGYRAVITSGKGRTPDGYDRQNYVFRADGA